MAAVWGRAEIEVDVDASGLPRQVRQAAIEAGQTGGDVLGKEFGKSFRKSIRASMGDALNEFGSTFSSSRWKNTFVDGGNGLGKALGRGFSNSMKDFRLDFERDMKSLVKISDDTDFSHGFRQFTEDIGELRQVFPALEGDFKRLAIGVGKNSDAFEGLSDDIGDLIIVTEDADGVFRDLSDSLDDAGDEARSAGEDFEHAGGSIEKATKATKKNTEETDNNSRSMGRAGRAVKKLGSDFKGFFRGLNKELDKNSGGWKSLSHNTRQWTLIIGAVAAALPDIAVLAGAAGAGLLVLGSAIGSLGVGLGVTIATFKRFAGDLENVPAEVRDSRRAFDGLKTALSELNRELTIRVFKNTDKAWKSLTKTIEGLEEPLGKVADVVHGLIVDMAKNLEPGTKNFQNLSKFIEQSAGVFDSLIRSVGIFGGALLTAFTNPAMVSAVDGLTGWIRDLATGFDDFVNSPGFGDFVDRGASVFEHLGELLEGIGNALSGLFDQQSTDNLNDFIDGLTDFFNGPGKSLIDFLDQLDIPGVVIDTLNTLGEALKPILDFATDFMKAHPKEVADAISTLAVAFLLFKGGTAIASAASSIGGFWTQIKKGKVSNINKLAGAIVGLTIAFQGLSDQNSENGGAGMSALGGAITGAQFGGPIGALVGVVAGLIASMISDVFLTPEVKGAWQIGWDQIFDPNNFDGAGIGEFKRWAQRELMGPSEEMPEAGGGWLDQVMTNWDTILHNWWEFGLPNWWANVTSWFESISLPGDGNNPWADTAADWGTELNNFFTITLPGWWTNITTWFNNLSLIGGGHNPWADTAAQWGTTINEFFTITLPGWWSKVTTWFNGLSLIGGGHNPWADVANQWGTELRNFLTITLPIWWQNIKNWFNGLSLIGSGSNPLADLAADWGRSLRSFVTVTLPNWWQSIVNFFSGKSLTNAIGNTFNLPGFGKGMASGGVLTGPSHVLAGEDGPEAIVPLKRSLSRVDPSVRALSAIAQGKTPAMGSGGVAGVSGRTVNVTNIINEAGNPQRTAVEVTNRIAERVAG